MKIPYRAILPIAICAGLVAATPNPFLPMVVVTFDDGSQVQAGASSTQRVQISSGDLYSPKTLRVLPPAGWKGKITVAMQKVTSLSLTDEGPHLDLLNWKHGLSEARLLPETGENEFSVQLGGSSSAPEFPPFSKKELREAVLQEFKKWESAPDSGLERRRWLAVLQEGKYVAGTSQLLFDVTFRSSEGPEESHRYLVINLALGC